MTNFIRKHSLLAMLFVSVMILNLTSCLSTADLTESQRIGVKHSPAALYSVYVDGNAAVYTEKAVRKFMNEVLTMDAGFTFVDQAAVEAICESSMEKAKRKAKFKNVMGVLTGQKSIGSAILDGIGIQYDREYIFKAIARNKATKSQFFVLVTVRGGVREDGSLVKPAVATNVSIYNKKNKLLKQITAVSSIEPIDVIDEESKNTVLDAFPELVEKSMALAAKNMHKKDKFFEINALTEATTEIVTNRPWPVGLKVYE